MSGARSRVLHRPRSIRAMWRGGALLFAASIVTWGLGASASAASSAQRPVQLDKSPVSSSVLMARAIRSGAVTLGGAHSVGNAGLRPSLTVLPNVKASSGTQPANETPIAADPSNGSHLETAANDYNCSSLQGVYNSDNGGATWRQSCAPVAGAGGCGDPNVAYDTTGTAYFLGISNCNGSTGSIYYQTSTNNGVSWSSFNLAFGSLLGGLTDKEWTEIDTNAGSPYVNCIYTSWTDFNSSFTQTRASVAHSCNGGASWTRVAVDSTQTVPKIDQFTDLAIGPTGTVYLTWMYCKTSGPAGDCGGTSVDLKLSKSTDGGNTWSAPTVMATVALTPDTGGCYYGCFPTTSERLADIPAIDIDKVDGSLHVGFYAYTGGKSKAQAIYSTNDGVSWSAPVGVLPTTLAGNQGYVWLAVSPAGKVGVSFFYSAVFPNYLEVAGISSNGGVSFAQKAKLSSATAKFTNDGFGGGFIGDYTGGIWTGETLHTSWSDARATPSVDETGGVTP